MDLTPETLREYPIDVGNILGGVSQHCNAHADAWEKDKARIDGLDNCAGAWAADLDYIKSLRLIIGTLKARIEELEKENAELRGMGHADLQAVVYHPDYGLAFYMMRDSEVTKRANIQDLARVASQEGASRGDWDGFRKHWWAAALAAGKD